MSFVSCRPGSPIPAAAKYRSGAAITMLVIFIRSDSEIASAARKSKENYGLAASNPFVDTSEFVTNRRKKRQNRKFRSNIACCITSPIDLRIRKMKTVFKEVSGNCGDVALPPAPVIDVRLIDQNQPRRHGYDAYADYELRNLVGTARKSQRDVPTIHARWDGHSASVLTAEVKSIGY